MKRLSLVLAIAALVTVGTADAKPVVGQPAPAFTVTDSNGKSHSLADFAGKTVVLEWNNPECPFVKKHYAGNMQRQQKDATGRDVVWLTINSGKAGKQGHLDGAGANAYMVASNASPTAYLIDADSAISDASISRNSVAIRSLIAFAITFARSAHRRPSRTARSVSGRSDRNATANRTRAFAVTGAIPVSWANQFAVR